MKEIPIIFKTEMVKAILEGRKTETRRVIKPQPIILWETTDNRYGEVLWKKNERILIEDMALYCPYGQVGDRLWVREPLRRKRNDPSMGADYITYVSDCTPVLNPNPNQRGVILIRPTWQWQKDTLSAMFMPRWASRINLEITGIRVERLQDISLQDANREGCPLVVPRPWFIELWDSLNAKRGYSWESNPWVWVIGFQGKES